MSEYVLTILPPDKVRADWVYLKHMLAAENYCDDLTSDEILERVDAGRAVVMLLLDGFRAVCAAAFEVYDRVLYTLMLSGRHVREFHEAFRRQGFADLLGVDVVHGFVRPSLARLMRQSLGGKAVKIMMEVPLR